MTKPNDLLAVWIGTLAVTLVVGMILGDSDVIIASLINLAPAVMVVLIILYDGGAK
jgi:hypothetical protein